MSFYCFYCFYLRLLCSSRILNSLPKFIFFMLFGLSTHSLSRVIGHDQRMRAFLDLHADKVGQLNLGNKVCTASLVSENVIATAYHCIAPILQNKDLIEDYSFDLLGKNPRRFGLKKILSQSITHDLVFLETKEKQNSFLPLSQPSVGIAKYIGIDPKLGYLMLHSNCSIERLLKNTNFFVHNCDAVSGSSGSPLIQKNKIIDIHLGFAGEIGKNIGVSILPSEMSRGMANPFEKSLHNELGISIRPKVKISAPNITPPIISSILPSNPVPPIVASAALEAAASKGGQAASALKKAGGDFAKEGKKQ